MTQLRIAGITKESVVDGPGLRYVIFTQGCPHHCVGCHNPDTQNFAGGYDISIAKLLDSINAAKLIDGVTFSGGEPFAQAAACAELAKLIKKNRSDLNIITYSGYYYTELLAMAIKDPAIKGFLQSIDILIDGPYDATKNDPNLPFRGSSNQNIIELSKTC
ncbi:Anaerobic ribonucleoside-triphosphate reductase-activating protein [Gammaproteobacteria bacterium]